MLKRKEIERNELSTVVVNYCTTYEVVVIKYDSIMKCLVYDKDFFDCVSFYL
jgi:hypothetical protein